MHKPTRALRLFEPSGEPTARPDIGPAHAARLQAAAVDPDSLLSVTVGTSKDPAFWGSLSVARARPPSDPLSTFEGRALRDARARCARALAELGRELGAPGPLPSPRALGWAAKTPVRDVRLNLWFPDAGLHLEAPLESAEPSGLRAEATADLQRAVFGPVADNGETYLRLRPIPTPGLRPLSECATPDCGRTATRRGSHPHLCRRCAAPVGV